MISYKNSLTRPALASEWVLLNVTVEQILDFVAVITSAK